MQNKLLVRMLRTTIALVLAIAVNFSAAWGLSKFSTLGERTVAMQPKVSQFAMTFVPAIPAVTLTHARG